MTQTLGLATRTAREDEISEPGLHLILPAPTFAEVRKLKPERGLFLSTLLHACAVAALVWLPLFAPVKEVPLYVRSIEPGDLVSIPYPDLDPLPALGDQGAKAGSAPNSKAAPGPEAKASAAAAPSGRTLAPYAGPQEIISDPPDATNNVQTIRRPDIIEPIKIKNPVRLRSRVEIPTPPVVAVKAAVPDWITHPTTQPVKPEPAEITSNAPPVERAVLVVRKSERAPRIVDAAPPSVVPDAKNAAPVLSAAPGNAPTLAKAVVVVNAVEVPPDPTVAIPNGEISGRFAVTPLVASVRAPDPNGTGAGDSAAANGAGAKSGSGTAGASGRRQRRWDWSGNVRPEPAETARPAVVKVERRRAQAMEQAPELARGLALEPERGMRREPAAGRERALGTGPRVVAGSATDGELGFPGYRLPEAPAGAEAHTRQWVDRDPME